MINNEYKNSSEVYKVQTFRTTHNFSITASRIKHSSLVEHSHLAQRIVFSCAIFIEDHCRSGV